MFARAQRAAVSLTEDWTAEYRGLVIGAPASALSFTAIEGLLSSPSVRTADRAVLNRHGEVSGRDFVASRAVTLTIEINGRDAAEFFAAMNAVSIAFTPTRDLSPFVFRFPGIAGGTGTRFIAAKVRRRSAPVDIAFSKYLATVTVELYAPSPLILDVTKLSGTAGLPNPNAPSGGISFPLTFPIRFGSPPDPGVIRVENKGSFDAFPRFRVSGPVADPQVVNLGTGERLTFRCVLAAGEWLDVDTYTHEVLFNGTAPRFVLPGSDNTWPTCPPGLTEIAFRGLRLDPGPAGDDASLLGEWASAWV